MGDILTNQEETLQRGRIVWLAAVLAAMAIYLLLRLAGWQLLPHPEYEDWGAEAANVPDRLPAVRGAIRDANGYALAIQTYGCTVYVFPPMLNTSDRRTTIAQLAEILKQPEEAIVRMADRPPGDTRQILGAGLAPEVCGQLAALFRGDEEKRLKGVEIEDGYWRAYPDETLAAHVLGFVDLNGAGQYGVEGYYDGALRGRDGEWKGVRGPMGQQLMAMLGGYQPPISGDELTLTLDRNIQFEAERILWEGITENKATSGNIIVLDSRTGAILAMANMPTYYPAEYWYVASDEEHRNSCVGALYEPGSVLKSMTIAAALEAQVIRSGDAYDDRGSITVGEQEIKNWDRQAHGRTTMTELLAYSRNVGAAYVASLLGPTRFYETFRRFGFAEHTGVDLVGEERGVMRVPGDPYWHMSDLGRNAYGQGMSVTPLQVAAAYGALANDGILMRPYVVAEVRQGEVVTTTRPLAMRQVVSPDVAQQMTRLLTDAVALGMRPAMVAGYQVAGKSGTAGVPDAAGYDNDEVVASFVGYGPIPNPRFVILVKLDKPREGRWGLEVAAPEFARLFAFLMDYAGIPPGS